MTRTGVALCFLSILVLASIPQFASAADWEKEYCAGDRGVCQVYEQNGSLVDIYLRNKFPYESVLTTVTLEHTGRTENLKSHNALPLTMVCGGAQKIKAISFTILDTGRRWDTKLTWYWQYGSFDTKGDDTRAYSLPYEKGKRFLVCQGYNDTPTHNGAHAYSIDWLMPEGTPLCAAREGTVIHVTDHNDGGGFRKEYLDKNNLVLVLHDDGSIAQYAHIKKGGASVKEGDRVNTGDVIAFSGNVGYSQSPHLHFAVSRPLDGKRSTTIPVDFATDYADREVLEKGYYYQDTGVSAKKKMPLVHFEDVVLCKKGVDNRPVDIVTSFAPKDKVMIYVPLYARRDHRIQVDFFRDGNSVPVLKYDWTMKKGWWQAVTDVDLAKIPNPRGDWTARISIDREMIGTKKFTVRSGP